MAARAGLVRVILPRRAIRSVEQQLARLLGASGGIRAGRFHVRRQAGGDKVADIVEAAERQIAEYFNAKRKVFDLPLAFADEVPDFTRAVWSACVAIPYGEMRSYGWLAGKVGRPGASRAVGRALGANPLPLVVPCHRVIRQDGSLGGFSAGLDLKKRLLQHERRHA